MEDYISKHFPSVPPSFSEMFREPNLEMGEYTGPIVIETPTMFVQQVAPDQFLLHQKTLVPTIPAQVIQDHYERYHPLVTIIYERKNVRILVPFVNSSRDEARDTIHQGEISFVTRTEYFQKIRPNKYIVHRRFNIDAELEILAPPSTVHTPTLQTGSVASIYYDQFNCCPRIIGTYSADGITSTTPAQHHQLVISDDRLRHYPFGLPTSLDSPSLHLFRRPNVEFGGYTGPIVAETPTLFFQQIAPHQILLHYKTALPRLPMEPIFRVQHPLLTIVYKNQLAQFSAPVEIYDGNTTYWGEICFKTYTDYFQQISPNRYVAHKRWYVDNVLRYLLTTSPTSIKPCVAFPTLDTGNIVSLAYNDHGLTIVGQCSIDGKPFPIPSRP